MSLSESVGPTLPAAPPLPEARTLRVAAGIALYLLLGALTLAPLLCAAIPPLVDYPNHLARMWILLHAGDIPALAQNYVVHWRLLPNLAMDLVMPALAHILPFEQAGRVFIAVTMALPVLATVALHRALFGRVGLWPLCALLFVYNAALFWGFLNFLFTQGVALLAFAGWIASERWRTEVRVVLFSAAAALLVVMHLFAFGIYGLLVAFYELGKLMATHRWSAERAMALAVRLAQFGPAALLWFAGSGNGGPSYIHYGGLYDKLYAIMAPATFGWWALPFDLGVALAALVFLLYARRSPAFKLSPLMRMPVAALIIAAMLMPSWMSGSWLADIRLPVTLPFVLIASTRLEAPRRSVIAGFAVVALALFGTRLWLVSQVWRDADRHFAEFRAASRALPEGARLLVVQTSIAWNDGFIEGISPYLAIREKPTYYHMPLLAVIDRSAFIPYLFSGWTPVHPSARNVGRFRTVDSPIAPQDLIDGASSAGTEPSATSLNVLGEPPYWRDWPRKFDYVLWIDFDPPSTPPAPHLQPYADGSFFRIYRVVPD